MSLDSLLHFISSSGTDSTVGTDLAFAEVDPAGRVLSINPFGRLAWGWRAGTQLDDHLRFALESLETDEPCELPIQAGGLHLRGMRINQREGWFLIGHEAGKGGEQSQQISFRSLMDRIPQPAVSVTTAGLARYVNEAAASVLGTDAAGLTGRPVLPNWSAPKTDGNWPSCLNSRPAKAARTPGSASAIWPTRVSCTSCSRPRTNSRP